MVESTYYNYDYKVWVKVLKPQKITKTMIKNLSLSSRHLGKHNCWGQRK